MGNSRIHPSPQREQGTCVTRREIPSLARRACMGIPHPSKPVAPARDLRHASRNSLACASGLHGDLPHPSKPVAPARDLRHASRNSLACASGLHGDLPHPSKPVAPARDLRHASRNSLACASGLHGDPASIQARSASKGPASRRPVFKNPHVRRRTPTQKNTGPTAYADRLAHRLPVPGGNASVQAVIEGMPPLVCRCVEEPIGFPWRDADGPGGGVSCRNRESPAVMPPLSVTCCAGKQFAGSWPRGRMRRCGMWRIG